MSGMYHYVKRDQTCQQIGEWNLVDVQEVESVTVLEMGEILLENWAEMSQTKD